MSEQLPKQELWLKLMRMTTSPNDGEALTALRKATKLMDDAGWTWDKLIAGRITVVADPFASIPTPKANEYTPPAPAPGGYDYRNPTAHPRPSGGQPIHNAPPQKARQASRSNPIGFTANKFVSHCWCCGVEVVAQAGRLFKPADYGITNHFASKGYAVVCMTCETSGYVSTASATPKRNKGKSSISDFI